MHVVECYLRHFNELQQQFEAVGLGGLLQDGKVSVEEGLIVLVFRVYLQLHPGD